MYFSDRFALLPHPGPWLHQLRTGQVWEISSIPEQPETIYAVCWHVAKGLIIKLQVSRILNLPLYVEFLWP